RMYPRRFGPYELLCELGEGGMGAVHLGRAPDPGFGARGPGFGPPGARLPAPVPGPDAGGALGPCAAGAFTGMLGAGGTGRGAG
ncbi:hypothetical protein ABWI07_43550, partial [Actinomadura sp. NPDC000600]